MIDRDDVIKKLKKTAERMYAIPSHPIFFIVIKVYPEMNKIEYIDYIYAEHENDYWMHECDDAIYWCIKDTNNIPFDGIADEIMRKFGG